MQREMTSTESGVLFCFLSILLMLLIDLLKNKLFKEAYLENTTRIMTRKHMNRCRSIARLISIAMFVTYLHRPQTLISVGN